MSTNKAKDRKPPRARLSGFARNLLAEWQRLGLPVSEATVVVAVSGGADSSALFLGLDELIKKDKLRLKLIVAHLDHGLRKESSKDAEWVSKLGKELGYSVTVGRASLTTSKGSSGTGRTGSPKTTAKRKPNLEQAARNARYKFLQKTAGKNESTLVLTAHTLDDQAETILMRLLRGSAAEGLSGALTDRSLATGSDIRLIRPLLSWALRSDTENYCRLRQVDFRVDEMNDDDAFSRVRVRKQLLPLMKSFNSRIVEALSRTAILLNEDATALAAEARRLLETVPGAEQKDETQPPSLDVDVLLQAPAAVRRRALREWILRSRGDLRRLEMVHLLAVEKLLNGGRGGRVVELPGGMKVTRKGGKLELTGKKVLKKARVASRIPKR